MCSNSIVDRRFTSSAVCKVLYHIIVPDIIVSYVAFSYAIVCLFFILCAESAATCHMPHAPVFNGSEPKHAPFDVHPRPAGPPPGRAIRFAQFLSACRLALITNVKHIGFHSRLAVVEIYSLVAPVSSPKRKEYNRSHCSLLCLLSR